MSFLDTLKQTASESWQGIKNIAGAITAPVSSGLANLGSSLGITSTPQQTQQGTPTNPIQASFVPNASTIYGPGTGTSQGTIVNTPSGGVNISNLNPQGGYLIGPQNPSNPSPQYYTYSTPTPRPSTSQPAQSDPYANYTPPATHYDPQSKSYVPLGQSIGGATGAQAQSFGPGGQVNATTGVSGLTGASNRTGLLGATQGLAGMAPPGVPLDTGQEKNNQTIKKTGTQTPPATPPSPMGVNPLTGQPVVPTVPGGQTAPFKAGVPSAVTNAGNIESQLASIRQVLSSGQPITAQTRSQFNATLEQAKSTILAQIEADQGKIDQPVVDEAAQMDWMKQFPPLEQPNIKSQMDAARSSLGLDSLQANRINLMNQIQATNQVYDSIIKDIQANPEMPKGLAQRRLAEVGKQQAINVTNLTNQMAITQQQINDANDQLNQQYQIIQNEDQRYYNEMNRRQDFVNGLLKMPGWVNNVSDSSLKQIANLGVGYDFNTLKGIQSAAAESVKEYSSTITKEDAGGNVTLIGIRPDGTNQIIGTYEGIGTPTKSTGGTGGETGIPSGAPSTGEIKDWLVKNKQANPNMQYYDLWGQLAEELTKKGLNPSNYDQQFWEILHPEAAAGYQKYVKGSSGSGSNLDMILNSL